MAEVLSQEEINQLLSGIAEQGVGTEAKGTGGQVKISIYDFRRPRVFSESQHEAISVLHVQFARSVTTSLTSLFHTRAVFHIAGVCELTHEEFIRSIPDPAFLCNISLPPFPFSSVMEIDPPLISAVIDLLAGGDGSNVSILDKRKISELDKRVISAFLPTVIAPFGNMWNTKFAIHPAMGKIESNPHYVSIALPTEIVILITIESRIGEVQGMMNICYPVNFIRMLFMAEKIKKERANNIQKVKTADNLFFKKYNQYGIGNVSIETIKKYKKKIDMAVDKDTACSQTYAPVLT